MKEIQEIINVVYRIWKLFDVLKMVYEYYVCVIYQVNRLGFVLVLSMVRYVYRWVWLLSCDMRDIVMWMYDGILFWYIFGICKCIWKVIELFNVINKSIGFVTIDYVKLI